MDPRLRSQRSLRGGEGSPLRIGSMQLAYLIVFFNLLLSNALTFLWVVINFISYRWGQILESWLHMQMWLKVLSRMDGLKKLKTLAVLWDFTMGWKGLLIGECFLCILKQCDLDFWKVKGGVFSLYSFHMDSLPESFFQVSPNSLLMVSCMVMNFEF